MTANPAHQATVTKQCLRPLVAVTKRRNRCANDDNRNVSTIMRYTFAVLGDGAWGTAVALLLAQNPHHRVRLWSAREENARILREKRENVRLLPGVPIPESIDLTTDIGTAVSGI